jgi:hypothetical protein
MVKLVFDTDGPLPWKNKILDPRLCAEMGVRDADHCRNLYTNILEITIYYTC